MCKFWKPEKCNHHFPELNKRKNNIRLIARFFTPNKIATMLVLAVMGVGFIYLMETNIGATKGYKINDLGKKAEELKQEYDKLNLQYIESQSMANIINKTSDLNLVAIDDIEVINQLGSAVAFR